MNRPDFAMLPESDGVEFELTRRQLLRLLGGGILALAIVPEIRAVAWAQRQTPVPQHVSAWVHIAPDGKITVFSGKTEVGQNVRTSLTQAAAEELRVPIESIQVLLADTDLVPFDMGTFGSRSTPTMVPQVRRAAAAAREALVDLAAERWRVDRKDVSVKDGVVSVGNQSSGFGDLAKGQAIDRPIDANIPLTPPNEWKVLGKPTPKIDGRSFVTGAHVYTSDLNREGMLHAKVLRPPSFGAELTSVDTAKASAMPGVKVVHDGDFVAVAAPSPREARAALAAIRAEWKEHPGPAWTDVHALLRGDRQPPAPTAEADVRLKQSYRAAYIAHVPLEPRAALAEWDGEKLTVSTGTQRPFGVRDEVAAALNIEPNKVRVIVPDTGSGYGGKHTGDAAVEAARIAKAVGKPVKLVWTRNEEFTFAYFRPAGVVEVSSGASKDGRLTYWDFDNYNSGGAALGTPYRVASPRCEFHEAASPLRQGSYRGLAATLNNFARETHMDELAHELGIDPLEFRLNNLENERLKAVLAAAAERFGWKDAKPASGRGFGLACGTEKGSYVATCAEVEVSDGHPVRLIRQVTAFECGAILNPHLLKNQVEGAVVMGIGGALFEEIRFDGGKILNGHLADYRVPRYLDIPAMETVLLDRKDLPSAGSGETPIIAIAPAIGNAIFNASGKRLRSLPLRG